MKHRNPSNLVTILCLILGTGVLTAGERGRTLDSPLGTTGSEESQVIRVDCDAGESLATALARAEGGRGTHSDAARLQPPVIQVHGTCVGQFVIETDDLVIRGARDATLRLPRRDLHRDPACYDCAAVLTVRGVVGVSIENLRLQGQPIEDTSVAGIFAIKSELSLTQSNVGSVDWGILASDSFLRMTQSEVTAPLDVRPPYHASYGVVGEGGSSITIGDSIVAESLMLVHSTGSVRNSEFISNRASEPSSNVVLMRQSVLTIGDSDLNGPWSHVWDQSRLELADVRTEYVWVDERSSISLFNHTSVDRLDIQDGAFVSLDSGVQVRRLRLRSFSRLVSTAPQIEQLTCDATSDAACERSDRVSESSCGSCPVNSLSSPAIAPTMPKSDPIPAERPHLAPFVPER